MTLKEYRISLGITIKEASQYTGVPIRTYIRYENDESYGDKLKRNAIFKILLDKFEITPNKGILTLEQIKNMIWSIFEEYGNNIDFCYLFGSYAKGYANENSDVDLCISTNLTGLSFVGLKDKISRILNKNVDLLRLSDLNDNVVLINEIMKDGIKIYEQYQK